jgi:hypothetical protein
MYFFSQFTDLDFRTETSALLKGPLEAHDTHMSLMKAKKNNKIEAIQPFNLWLLCYILDYLMIIIVGQNSKKRKEK